MQWILHRVTAMSGAAEPQDDLCGSEDNNDPDTEDLEELDVEMNEVHQHHQLLPHLHRDVSFHKSQKEDKLQHAATILGEEGSERFSLFLA